MGAERSFAGGHLSVVGFVVKTREVKEAVEEKDSYFVAEGVAVSAGLSGSGFEGDGEIACVGVGDFGGRRKAEDIGGFIFAAKRFVEAAESGVICEQDLYFAAETNCSARAVEEARQAGARESFFEAGR